MHIPSSFLFSRFNLRLYLSNKCKVAPAASFAMGKTRFLSLFVLLFLTACAPINDTTKGKLPNTELGSNKRACQVIYDAGSSGTRLYIYEQTKAGWLEHEGPKVAALADPIRESRGKKFTDVKALVTDIAGALPAMLEDGPLDNGKPSWKGFDWKNKCSIDSASVFATAGMRIAEQWQRKRSSEVWAMISVALSELLGPEVQVTARTLSGFEEGLFAWLALAEREGRRNFGIAEMGGASAQIVYPCDECDANSDSVRTIRVNGRELQLYSHSYLGLGTDEAYRSLGFPMSCRYGIGQIDVSWKSDKCADHIPLTSDDGRIYDPYNFAKGRFGSYSTPPTANVGIDDWFLTGAFAFMRDNDIDDYCLNQNGSFDTEYGCFRAVYLRHYLDVLNLKAASTSRSSWTLGAALCQADNCLEPAKPAPVCRWSSKGCLN